MRTGSQPAGFSDVRVANLGVALRHIRHHAPCSRADIAAATGLNKATVSSLVAELIDRRVVRETGIVEHRIGRPATMIVIDGSAYAAVGLQIDADRLIVEGVTLAGEQALSWRRAFPGLTVAPSRAVASIISLLRKAIARIGADGRQVLGVTVGVPGLVDADGVVTAAPSLGWQDIDLRNALINGLQSPEFPVVVENDALLTALAEYRFGEHAGTANLVALSGRLGAGIITDRQPMRGALGYAGQIAHLPVDVSKNDPPVEPCHCGRIGCLEASAGIAALVRRLNPDMNGDGPVTDFQPEVRRIAHRAAAGDQVVLAALDQVGRHLGYAASLLADLLNPEVVVLGGYYVELGRWLLPAATAALHDGAVAPRAGGCRLTASTLGDGAAALGGIAQTLDAADNGVIPRLAR